MGILNSKSKALSTFAALAMLAGSGDNLLSGTFGGTSKPL